LKSPFAARAAVWSLVAILCVVAGAISVQGKAEAYLVEKEVGAVRNGVAERVRRFDEALAGAEASARRFAALVSCRTAELAAEPDAFGQVMHLDPDGLWRSDRQRFDARTDAGLWLPSAVAEDPLDRRFFMRTRRVTRTYGLGASTGLFADTWVLPLTNGEAIFFPQDPAFIYNASATLDYRSTEWVALTDPATNPDGRARWTSTSFDPAARAWMISVVAPFSRDDRWAGSVGHDILLPRLFEALLGGRRADDDAAAPLLVARDDGQLLFDAGHAPVENARVPARFAALFGAPDPAEPIRVLPDADDFVIVASLPTLQARVLYLVPGAGIRGALRSELLGLHLAQGGAIVLSLLVAGVFLLRDARHRRDRQALLEDRNRALLLMVDERTAELTAANAKLERLSQHDHLTGLFNRRGFEAALDQSWRRGRRSRQPLSLVMIDVDFFKPYNDFLGHLAGDACLQRIGKLVGGAAQRGTDTAARYGGEEFVLVLQDTDERGAYAVAERLRESVHRAALPHPTAEGGRVTVSLGIATAVPDADGTPERLLGRADEALYIAKERGRNRVECAPAELALRSAS
jgi:diguanylate cyclase (GGDEF)-like protein